MLSEFNRAQDQAQAQLSSIRELVAALETDDDDAREAAETAILESPLSAEEDRGYTILLCAGGPAVQITGSLDEHGEPVTARLEYQDWFTPWVEVDVDPEDTDTLLAYARQFSF